VVALLIGGSSTKMWVYPTSSDSAGVSAWVAPMAIQKRSASAMRGVRNSSGMGFLS
jgi:hypothetical protein